jgi:hypothetical protein
MKEQKSSTKLLVAGAESRLESFAKYAGLATVAVEWSSLLIYYLKMPLYFGGTYPISYFATLPQTRLVFSICYVLAAIFCWIFVKHHLGKYYRTPLKIFGASLLLFAAMGLFPYDPSDVASQVIHTSLILSCGILFFGGMYMLARHAKDKTLFNVTIVAIILGLSFNIALFLSPPDSHMIFALEAGGWLMVQFWIIWISFYSHKRKRLD